MTAMRQGERSGRRIAVAAVAVAVVVIAVGSVLAFGGGWLRPLGIGSAATSPPESLAPEPSTTGASDMPATGAPSTDPLPTADPDRPPLGLPNAAVVVRIAPEADGRMAMEVDLLREMASVQTVYQAPLPEDRVPSDDPPRVSADGLLAVPLADAADLERPRGVVVYDLLDEAREPQTFDTDDGFGANGVAWSTDGRLAIVDPTSVTTVRPFEPPDWATVNIPDGTFVVPAGPADDVAWAVDGRGFTAWKNGNDPPSGILTMDGTFEPELPWNVADPTGNARMFDADGRVLQVGCLTMTEDAVGRDCRLLVQQLSADAVTETWFVVPDDELIADYRWEATRERAWILVERAAPDGSPGSVDLRHGDARGFETVATHGDVGAPRILGVSADDGRIAIDLGDGTVQTVDPTSGTWSGTDGVFAGWADQGGSAD